MKNTKNWLKRSFAMLLAVVTLMGTIPATAIAALAESVQSNVSYIPGDVNGDGKVDAMDVNLVRRYIAGSNDVSINTLAADVNADGLVDMWDVIDIRCYIVGGYEVELRPGLEPETPTYSVNFYDGDRLIDTLTAEQDKPLGAVPAIYKSSKSNAILVGYYLDPEFTQPFYAENPVTGNMNVYAKYEEMGSNEVLNFTSFAQMDQNPDISFEIVGDGDPAEAVTLEVMDGSDPVELKFEAIDGGYKVSAVNGFNEGASYQLHLTDGWIFKDKPDTIRTATFSIDMEQVQNMQMSDDIVYILDTDAIDYTVDGETYEMLTSELITEQGGSFTYGDAETIKNDDILCIYTGVHPEERDFNGDMLDPAYYVKVTAVNGSVITFTTLGDDDFLRLYNIPDNFPLRVDALPNKENGTININKLDEEMYVLMQGEGYDLAKAKSLIEVGDFISLYIAKEAITTDDDIYFGIITDYNVQTGEITYKKTTKQAILDSMDLYRDIEVSGDDLVTDEEKEEIESVLLSQIQESGFAEDAAFMLADMVTKTDGFKNADLQTLFITDSNGNQISPDELQLMNIGKNFELTDDIKLTVEIIKKGDQLRYKNGTRIVVGVEAEFEVELEDDEKIVIELSADFVQEVEVSPRMKGYVVPYVIFLIPVPVGANLNGTVDIKSFTAFSFAAEVYTVAPEDESIWQQFKDVVENPEKLADLPGLPDDLSKGLTTVGDVFDKIEELEDNLAKVKDDAEKYQGYLEDLNDIWDYVEENGLTSREDWAGMCEALDKTSITSDLLEMMDLTNETELETEYYESMEALMERYCEMVEKETDWVTLLKKDIFNFETCVYGVAIGVDVDFMVRADLSLAIGSNLQYEIGKRYEFWFKFAPFWKKAGCTSMDLLDESFAFQFYVMGRLGLKAGIKAKLECGIGSCFAANAGVSVELGPYFKLWGFFVYENEKYRAANTDEWHCEERMAGALLMEFGLYFKMAFEAEAIGGMFSYDYEFVDEEIPILTIGDKYFYYQPNYMPEEDEVLIIKDVDDDSKNGISMILPEYMLALDYVNLKEGYMAIDYVDYDNFIYTVSNPNFSIDRETGEISVNVPDGVRYMECDLTITYKYGKLAFSTVDMSVTIPLVWTNLASTELSEYYTAAVRVGNDKDGYTTVWQKRVLKNKEFDLPSTEEIMGIIGWNEYKFGNCVGYGNQQTEGLTLIDDVVYDFNVEYKTYTITVNGVQSANGKVGSKIFTAKYGDTFNFASLKNTGTVDYTKKVFTKFSELTTFSGIDLSKAIDTRMAAALLNGVTATAKYVDNSATATFTFSGLDVDDVTVIMARGEEPDLTEVQRVAEELGLAIKDITPVVAPITSFTMYQVICGELDTEPATITFEENGGGDVNDITKPYGSLIGTLPTPEKSGYTFAGWYEDEELTTLFSGTKIPQGGKTLYAKWTANKYTLTFKVNGGDELEKNTKTVTYGKKYGTLPTPQRVGYACIGWFTKAEGGTQVVASDIYSLANKQTIYAQWRKLVDLPADTVSFGETKIVTYKHYKTYGIDEFSFAIQIPEGLNPEDFEVSDFNFEFLCEGYENEGYVAAPEQVGIWGVKVSRPADDYCAKFEVFIPGVLVIEKATRGSNEMICVVSNEKPEEELVFESVNGLTYLELKVVPFDWENPSFNELYYIDVPQIPYYMDATESVQIIINAYPYGTGHDDIDSKTPISSSGVCDPFEVIRLHDLDVGTKYTLYGKIVNDRNYHDAHFFVVYPFDYWGLESNKTKDAPGGLTWTEDSEYYTTYDISWYNETDTEFVINTAAELAGVAKLVNSGTDSFAGKTIKLGADVDLSEHPWTPIGISSTVAFSGTFDGQGHTVSGMYFNDSGKDFVGLFGYAYPKYEKVQIPGSIFYESVLISNPVICDLVVDDSWIYGKSYVGAVAGYIYDGLVLNCVNYGYVMAYQRGSGDSYLAGVGGIVGGASSTEVYNCVNYGNVYAQGRHAGGIVGLSEGTTIVENNANFGSVTGSSRVGGIVGCMDGKYTETYNNYNVGKIRPRDGSNDYIGSIVGRNVSDDGTAQYNYYLYGCASGGNGKVRAAMGKDGGSVKDGEKKYYAASFSTVNSSMASTAGSYGTGRTLIEALNSWVESNGGMDAYWEAADENSYPLPVGTHTSFLRQK